MDTILNPNINYSDLDINYTELGDRTRVVKVRASASYNSYDRHKFDHTIRSVAKVTLHRSRVKLNGSIHINPTRFIVLPNFRSGHYNSCKLLEFMDLALQTCIVFRLVPLAAYPQRPYFS